jgi:hypothetical protein
VDINLLFSTIGRILFKSVFSKILETMGKRLIGRYDVTSFSWLQDEDDLCDFPL